MTEHACCYQLVSNREPANHGDHPQRVYVRELSVVPTAITDPILTPGLSPGLIPPSAWADNVETPGMTIVRRVWGRVVTDGPAFAMLEARDASPWGSIDGVMTDNGLLNVIRRDPQLTVGRQAPPVILTLGGDIFTVLDALAGAVIRLDLQVTFGYPEGLTYTNWEHFIEFEDRPPNTNADGSTANRALFRRINATGARYLLGVTSAAQNVYVNACNFAAALPEGRFIIRPEDIGVNAEQIPPDIASNTAAHFRFHPGVFIRRKAYISGLTRMNADPTNIADPVSVEGQPFRITSITAAPTHSNWLLVIDGQLVIVGLAHPAGSDFRRPRDIWNNVWVPIVDGSQSVANAVTYRGVDGIQTAASSILDRIRYLQYARCLSVGDPGDETDIPQAGLG